MPTALVILATLLVGDRPASATAAFGRAQAAIAEQRCDKAIEGLTKALEADPTYWEAHRAMAECLVSLKRPDEAVAHVQQWVALRPTDASAPLMLSKVVAEADKLKKRSSPAVAARGTATPSPTPKPMALGDVARMRGNPKPGQPGQVLTLSSQGDGYQPPPIPEDAPVTLLDSMARQAEQAFRPRMQAVAPSVKQLRTLRRRYLDACWGKTTSRVTRGIAGGAGTTDGAGSGSAPAEDLISYRSQSAWAEQWRTVTTSRNEEMPECRALASDINALIDEVEGALDGADAELARPPAVYPGVREQVFARLADELW